MDRINSEIGLTQILHGGSGHTSDKGAPGVVTEETVPPPKNGELA